MKSEEKEKSPVTIRYKELKNGNQSVYLDIYVGNGQREYKFLNHETNDFDSRKVERVLEQKPFSDVYQRGALCKNYGGPQ